MLDGKADQMGERIADLSQANTSRWRYTLERTTGNVRAASSRNRPVN